MRILLSVVSWALLVNGAVLKRVTPEPLNLIEHESRLALPANWKYLADAADTEPLSLRIALREAHEKYLEIAEAVSNPSSSRYGQYLSLEELRRALPDFESAARDVVKWLDSTGAQEISVDGELVDFVTEVGKVKDAFNSTFGWYQYQDDEPVLRTQSYSIPHKLQDKVHFMFPAVHFLAINRMPRSQKLLSTRQHIPSPADCASSICPSNLTQKYSINYQPPDAKSGSRLGVAGFLEQYGYQPDVDTFFNNFTSNPISSGSYKFTTESINGGKTASSASHAGAEALLDLEYTMAFVKPLGVTYYSTGGRPPTLNAFGNATIPTSKSQNEPYIQFLQYLLKQQNPPQVVSISYTDDEQTVPRPYAQRVCNLFGRLAARGVSVIIASGDGGSVGTSDNDCTGPNGKRRFIPTFPPSCPWVTSVGATASYGGAAGYSGGGLSNYFARPDWQNSGVSGYLKALKGKHKGYYNASGRGSPDVALVGSNYVTVIGGYALQSKGTSASTPVFASMVALINDIRLRAGKPVLGFLNPLLYSANFSQASMDVTEGNTDGCSDSHIFEPGWEALPGWDAATGLGEPNFSKLRQLLA